LQASAFAKSPIMVYLLCIYEREHTMKTRVQKWGNSLAVRIPKSFATEAGIDQDAVVDVTLVDGKLILTPLTPARFTLEHLLAAVTVDNLHTEQDTGAPVGNEAW
jgi:antitoxin MazE